MSTPPTPLETQKLFKLLEERFAAHKNTHLNWKKVQARLHDQPSKIRSLIQMEETGGEPALIKYDKERDQFVFYDCSLESPKGRRSVCYDQQALDSRKKHKPLHSAIGMAKEMGIELLTRSQYEELQQYGTYDLKSSSWLSTPVDIRNKGGAIFADYRYGHVFYYHNGASSYYASRGFRGCLYL